MSGTTLPPTTGKVGGALYRAAAYFGHAMDVVAPMLPQFSFARRSYKRTVVDDLVIRCHRALPSDVKFAAAWEQLYKRCPDATPFHTLAWQRSVLLTAQATRRLRLFAVWDCDRLIGVFPLESRRGTLRSTGGIITNYLEPLIDPEFSSRCWRAFLGAARKLMPGYSITIKSVREESIACQEAQHAAEGLAGFEHLCEAEGTVARVPLPATWDEYLAALNGHDRRELKRRLRKAQEQAGARLEIITEPARVTAQIHTMLELLRESGGGKSLKARWLFPRHFATCAEPLARSGRLAIYTLMLNDHPAAWTIQLPTPSGLIGWNITFDPAMRDWSPGIVLLAMVIRHSIEQGFTMHDMSSGNYDYKYRLGARDYPLHKLTLQPAA